VTLLGSKDTAVAKPTKHGDKWRIACATLLSRNRGEGHESLGGACRERERGDHHADFASRPASLPAFTDKTPYPPRHYR